MPSFELKWNALTATHTPEEERAQAEQVLAFARQHHVTYQLALADARTGAAIPVFALGRDPAAKVRVQVTVEEGSARRSFTWEPKDAANVTLFLRE